MRQDLFLFLIILMYNQLIIYLILRDNTNVYNFKDYRNWSGKIFYVIIATQLLIFIVFEFLKYNNI